MIFITGENIGPQMEVWFTLEVVNVISSRLYDKSDVYIVIPRATTKNCIMICTQNNIHESLVGSVS